MMWFVSSVRHKNRRGFTLIELLVVLTILGLLTGLFAGFLHLGQRSWIAANQVAVDVDSVEDAQSFLRHELAQVQPILISKQGQSFVGFNGTADALSFYARLPQAFEDYGIAEIRLSIQPGSGQNDRDLVAAWRPLGSTAWHSSILLANIRDIHFSYYGDADGLGWRSSWAEKKTLPQAIKLDVDFNTGETRHWPQFIVIPMITIGSNVPCVWTNIAA